MDNPNISPENLLKSSDIKENELHKLREQAASSLSALLKIRLEVLVKHKVKDETLTRTQQHHLQQAEAEKNSLQEQVARLTDFNGKLENSIKMEPIISSQFEREVSASEDMINMVKNHFNKSKDEYELLLKKVSNMETTFSQLLHNYEAEKAKSQNLIENKLINLSNMKHTKKLQIAEYESDVNKRNYELLKLSEENTQFGNEVKKAENELSILKTEYEENNLLLTKLTEENDKLETLINSNKQQLIEMKEQLEVDKKEHDSSLEKLKVELNENNEIVQMLNNEEIHLHEECQKTEREGEKLEAMLLQLNEENKLLLSESQKIKDTNDVVIADKKARLSFLQTEYEKITLEWKHYQEQIENILLVKENKVKEQEKLKLTLETSGKELKKLQDLKEILEKENAINLTELDTLSESAIEMRGEIKTFKESIENIKGKQSGKMEENKKIKEELHCKLSIAQSNLEEVTRKFEIISKKNQDDLNNFKYELERVHERKCEEFYEKLNTLNAEEQNLQKSLQEKTNTVNKISLDLCNVEKLLHESNTKMEEIQASFNTKPSLSNQMPMGILKSPGQVSSVLQKRVKFDSVVEEKSDESYIF